jgi:L-alanine-DL-glutamate epimerase-like enolase superfamily enzyme
MSPDLIAAADVALVAIPLERAIRLGPVVINEREFAALRLRTSSGVEGVALGYTRGLPLAEALLALAAQVVGRDASLRAEVIDDLEGAALGPAGARALSLVEIALWDIEAKTAEQPLWRHLGGESGRVPILAVGGYFLDERTIEDVEDELRALVAAGFTHVKVHAHDPVVIERLRDAVGDDALFSVDLHMRFTDIDQARRECAALDQLGLGFIEDPFPPDRPDLTAALAAELQTPVAAGEDAIGLEALLALARSADVLRVDATVSGGISAALQAADEAVAHGHTAMTHAFVELHAQVAGGSPAIAATETIPYSTGANPVDRLLRSTQAIESGSLVLSEEPGHGLDVDWDALTGYSRRMTTVPASEGARCN